MRYYSDLFILKCPNSGSYFKPERTNQFFKTRKDGADFRNRLKSLNYELKWKTQAELSNLKILVPLLRKHGPFISRYDFDLLNLEYDGLNPRRNPFDSKPSSALWFEVVGFWVRRGRKFCYIIPPELTRLYKRGVNLF